MTERIRNSARWLGTDLTYDHRAYRNRFTKLHVGTDGRLHPWWCMAVPWVGVDVGRCDCARAEADRA